MMTIYLLTFKFQLVVGIKHCMGFIRMNGMFFMQPLTFLRSDNGTI